MNPVNDRIRVELVHSNVMARQPCHVCDGETQKTPVLAEVLGGRHKGFRVCDECLREGGLSIKLQARAQRLRAEADELTDLADHLDVPTWRDYLLAGLRAEAAREDDGMDSGAAHWLGLVGDGYYSALTSADVCLAFGVTLAQAEAEKRELGKRKAAAWKAQPIARHHPF